MIHLAERAVTERITTLFSKLLNQLVSRTEGAEMVLLVGTDGIVIERAGEEKDVEFDNLAAEYAVVLNRSRATATDTGLGQLNELLTITDQAVLLTRILNEDYFVMMKLNNSSYLGRARYEARRAELLIEEMFA
ncbi:MAG: roadblock/LC7 domain-containing protein [Acidobacteria bacterium]|nr:roadblock/LC7 domain-containing protein [Acidobacteriota bacterium]